MQRAPPLAPYPSYSGAHYPPAPAFAPLPVSENEAFSPAAHPHPYPYRQPENDYGYGGHGQPHEAHPEAREGSAKSLEFEGAVQGYERKDRTNEGKLRRFCAAYKSRNQVLFLSIIGIQVVVVLTMIGLIYGFVRANTGDLDAADFIATDPALESVATYVGLFILAVVFEVLVTLDACQQKNIMVLFTLCLFQVAMLVYSCLLPRQLRNAISGSNADTPRVQDLTHSFAVVIPCIVGASTVAMSAMLWPLYHEFGWRTFKRIGADLAIRRAYLRYQIFLCLLRFDAFFVVGFSIQFLILVSGTPTVELVLTIVALPVAIIALLLFAVIVRIESRPGVYAAWVLQAAGMAYFAYKLARIYGADSGDRYRSTRATLTVFSIICIALLIATFILMGMCLLNFGKGLRERIPGYAFNGGRSLLRSRADADASLTSPTALGASVASSSRPFSPGTASEKGSARPGMKHVLSDGSGIAAERTETRMSMD
ncbi:hypothetical protein Rhopal_001477-T1 [Rhodotorula paludigena]|uniref:Uncharacterized protein n=1 Tax=Rhodotorula paludigena TaxID=86838 RepID=A0AAV5GFV8_9BASI|nr:hypothetical protein Rhopal_001477-T1 [Rhodotorula paludigena]